MNFSPLCTSSWDSSLLDRMLCELRAAQGDLPDVSMAEEDFNVGEETSILMTQKLRKLLILTLIIQLSLLTLIMKLTLKLCIIYLKALLTLRMKILLKKLLRWNTAINLMKMKLLNQTIFPPQSIFLGALSTIITLIVTVCPDDPLCLCLSKI